MNPQNLYTRYQSLYDIMIRLVNHTKKIAAWLESSHLIKSNIRILDAGCGSGAVSKAVLSVAYEQNISGVQLYGFDLTTAMLDEFKAWLRTNKPAERVVLQQANVLELDTQLPADWQNFDIILSSGMLEYVPKTKLAKALQSLDSVLTAHGTLVVFISRKNFYTKLLIERTWKAHIFTEQELREQFIQAGLSIKQLDKFKTWGWVVVAKQMHG